MAKRRKTIVDQLKDAIRKSGKTHYRIAKDAGIGPGQIDRFVSGERDIRISTAAKKQSRSEWRIARGPSLLVVSASIPSILAVSSPNARLERPIRLGGRGCTRSVSTRRSSFLVSGKPRRDA